MSTTIACATTNTSNTITYHYILLTFEDGTFVAFDYNGAEIVQPIDFRTVLEDDLRLPAFGHPDILPWHEGTHPEYHGDRAEFNCFGGTLGSTQDHPTGKWLGLSSQFSVGFLCTLPGPRELARKFIASKLPNTHMGFRSSEACEAKPDLLVCVRGKHDPWVWDKQRCHLPSGAYACKTTLDLNDMAERRYLYKRDHFEYASVGRVRDLLFDSVTLI